MSTDLIRRIFLLIGFALVQGLVLGHIHVFNCATPLLFVYFALIFPRNYPHWVVTLMCFLLGLSIDSLNNTQGLTSASLTLTGFVQPYILSLYLDREDAEDFRPSIATMGWVKFSTFAFILTFINCIVYFSLEAFSFFNWQQWLLCIGGSFLITLILILIIDSSIRKSIH